MDKIKLESINYDRAATMLKTLIPLGGIPVIVCSIREDKRMIVFGFSQQGPDLLKKILQDFIASMENGEILFSENL